MHWQGKRSTFNGWNVAKCVLMQIENGEMEEKLGKYNIWNCNLSKSSHGRSTNPSKWRSIHFVHYSLGMFVDALQACTACTTCTMAKHMHMHWHMGSDSIGERPLKLTWMSIKAMHTINRNTFAANRMQLAWIRCVEYIEWKVVATKHIALSFQWSIIHVNVTHTQTHTHRRPI